MFVFLYRVYIEQDDAFNQKLYINRITERDAGRYTCQTRQASGTLNGMVEIAIYGMSCLVYALVLE